MSKGRIIIADDEELVRHVYQVILGEFGGYEIVASVENGEKLVKVVRDLTPDLVLTDFQMPGSNGFDAASLLRKEKYMNPILFVTGDIYHLRQRTSLTEYLFSFTKPDGPQETPYWALQILPNAWALDKTPGPHATHTLVDLAFAGQLRPYVPPKPARSTTP